MNSIIPHPRTIARDRVFANAGALVAAGMERSPAIAHALTIARAEYFKRFPDAILPPWLACRGVRHRSGYTDAGSPLKGVARRAKENPAPVSKLAQARKLFESFTGERAEHLTKINFKNAPFTAGLIVGNLLALDLRIDGINHCLDFTDDADAGTLPALVVSSSGRDCLFVGGDFAPARGLDRPEIIRIMYETVRDGVAEKYQHPFKHSAYPHLEIFDKRNACMFGGTFRFTDRGFIG